jgi:hypothetical protein
MNFCFFFLICIRDAHRAGYPALPCSAFCQELGQGKNFCSPCPVSRRGKVMQDIGQSTWQGNKAGQDKIFIPCKLGYQVYEVLLLKRAFFLVFKGQKPKISYKR